MSIGARNPTPSTDSSCMYSSLWSQKDESISWGLRDGSFYAAGQVTTDAAQDKYEHTKDDDTTPSSTKPSGEKNGKKLAGSSNKHVPHRYKPPQVVAKRNARERNRVEAVNGAFVRLRKAVPIQHARGKRISKVKTLQNAINYIRGLEELLETSGYFYEPISVFSNFYECREDQYFQNIEFDE